ncbi:Pectate lyase [Thalictrum thalictroides]|uniref:Pectate lyase n=1 Tax=Thalictrum thalictroides TaxID=46969 RepID=A0A7J6WAP6_THATH|nr:Pectate lyase [Thalictrum thalictroides]
MASSTSLLLFSCLLTCLASSIQAYSLANTVNTVSNKVQKSVLNKIDSCWRSDPNWAMHRQALADCAVGFGKAAIGGKYGAIYVVTNPSDDPANPKPGTLRYGVIQTKPLWIIFARDMVIKLQNELMMNSFKTIDGRGVKVEIANGPCITIQGVMLFGHNDQFTDDKIMKVTVVFNHFGPGLIERMPRVRFGYAHVANNRYESWQMYAIGGSANPTILSEGNYFFAPKTRSSKQVTKRESGGWKNWKWRSSNDMFLNGAFFVQSGWGSCAPNYSKSQVFSVAPGALVPALTSNAGPLQCVARKPCY